MCMKVPEQSRTFNDFMTFWNIVEVFAPQASERYYQGRLFGWAVS